MATIVAETTIRSRLKGYDSAFPTPAAKRGLAQSLITPDAEIPAYTGLDEIKYQLSLLWALPQQRVEKVASYLWSVLPAAKDYAGQRAVVFTHGNRDTVRHLRYGEYISMVTGFLPAAPEMRHFISGRLNPNSEPSVEGIRAPYARGVTRLPLSQTRRIAVDSTGFDIGEIHPDEVEVPIYEATAHVGDDRAYAAGTAEISIHQLLAGNIALIGFAHALARETRGDSAPLLRAFSHVASVPLAIEGSTALKTTTA